MNIIKSFRTNHTSFDELFGGIKKDKSDKNSKDQNPSPHKDEDEGGNDEPKDENCDSPNSENKNNDSERAENDHLDYFKDHFDKILNAEVAALELIKNLQIIKELRSKGW